MIDPEKLTLEDIGRTVIFRGEEKGTIVNFSKNSVEVLYPPRKSTMLSRPEDLDFIESKTAG
jgi:hypothetical protein